MGSIVWDRDPQEAMDNPYEYHAQKQFHREAISLTNKLCETIVSRNDFLLDENTLGKATWLLQTDALFAFKDAVELLEIKKHKVVGRLLRDILETLHLVEYLNSGYTGASESLQRWYEDEPRTDKLFRAYVKNTISVEAHDMHHANYVALSKFTHRTYKTLLYGYAGCGNTKLFYDEQWSLPGTIAMYYALLGWMGNMLVDNLKVYGVIDFSEVTEYWQTSMEEFQIPRGWLSDDDKKLFEIES